MLEVPSSPDLYPLNVLREEHALHFGVRSIANQWYDLLQAKPDLVIHPRLLPTSHNAEVVLSLEPGQAWTLDGQTVAHHGTGEIPPEIIAIASRNIQGITDSDHS